MQRYTMIFYFHSFKTSRNGVNGVVVKGIFHFYKIKFKKNSKHDKVSSIVQYFAERIRQVYNMLRDVCSSSR